jgi:hypothetical protein
MFVLAVVACVAVLALVARKGTVRRHHAARPIDQRAADENPDVIRDAAGSQLTRLEHAIDAIAIEVERMGENQRFLTKLLASESPERAQSVPDRKL